MLTNYKITWKITNTSWEAISGKIEVYGIKLNSKKLLW